MTRTLIFSAVFLALMPRARAQDSFEKTTADVNSRMVKLYGAGGFRGVASYGTGVIVSPDGHVLTAASQLLDTSELRIVLSDGRKYLGKVVVVEPALDLAVVKIEPPENSLKLDLAFFNVDEAAKRTAATGDWGLAFSNCFEIAQRDEPMTIQRCVVAARTKLTARRGVTEIDFGGEVYYLDGIVNNPGSAGGAFTDRNGQLLGIIGKEFRNTQSDTWINYAIPMNCKVEVEQNGKTESVALPDFVKGAVAGTWKPKSKKREAGEAKGPGAYAGIIFVPNVVERTPAFVEAIEPNSPAAKAGLKTDDLIIYFDGEPVYGIKTFRELMTKVRPGTEVKLEVRRGFKLTALPITFGDFPKAEKKKE